MRPVSVRNPRSRHRWLWAVAVPVVFAVAASSAFAGIPVSPWDGLAPTVSPAGVLGTTLSLGKGSSGTLSSAFWGADLRPYYSLGSTQSATWNATPLSFVRWPGGAVADEFNVTANRIYYDNGAYYTPPENISEFAAWCGSVNCRAIVQLPAEIDSPSTAGYYVDYIEHTVGFVPAYWEIGNEPALWSHFGVGWTHWNTSQHVNATPGTFASVVQAYVAAIRAVDGSARIVGLGGVGTGAYNENIWIKAVVALNGPNLSAVAIHVYPASGANVGPNGPTVAGFFSSLQGASAIAVRVPIDRGAILAGCPSCTNLSVFVTEMGSATTGSVYDHYTGTPMLIPFLGAEIAQAMMLHVTNVDLYAFQSTYNGSLLNDSGVASKIDLLYRTMLTQLQPVVLNLTVSGGPGRFWVVAAHDLASKNYSLFVVNANTSLSAKFSLTLSGFPLLGSGAVYAWPLGATAPTVTTFSTLVPTLYTVAARGIVEITVST